MKLNFQGLRKYVSCCNLCTTFHGSGHKWRLTEKTFAPFRSQLEGDRPGLEAPRVLFSPDSNSKSFSSRSVLLCNGSNIGPNSFFAESRKTDRDVCQCTNAGNYLADFARDNLVESFSGTLVPWVFGLILLQIVRMELFRKIPFLRGDACDWILGN